MRVTGDTIQPKGFRGYGEAKGDKPFFQTPLNPESQIVLFSPRVYIHTGIHHIHTAWITYTPKHHIRTEYITCTLNTRRTHCIHHIHVVFIIHKWYTSHTHCIQHMYTEYMTYTLYTARCIV